MKRSRSDTLAAAKAFGQLFPRDSFERWNFAGSLRRGCAECKDAEHVVQANRGELPPAEDDLFAAPRQGNLLWHHLDRLLRQGVVEQAFVNGSPRWGERYRKVLFGGIVHDVFLADADNWGAILAIRTGPADFSRKLVTNLQRNDYVNHGGYVLNKRDWFCRDCDWHGDAPTKVAARDVPDGATTHWFSDPDSRDGGPFYDCCPNCGGFDLSPARVSVPDERAYFDLCGVPWLPPEDRR